MSAPTGDVRGPPISARGTVATRSRPLRRPIVTNTLAGATDLRVVPSIGEGDDHGGFEARGIGPGGPVAPPSGGCRPGERQEGRPSDRSVRHVQRVAEP